MTASILARVLVGLTVVAGPAYAAGDHACERALAKASTKFVGAAFKTFQGLLGGVKGTLSRSFTFFKGASLACDIDPTLLGVGYIIGYRTSMIMVSGSLLASLILVPMIVLFEQ